MNVMYIVNEIGLGGAAQSLLDMLQGICFYINPVVVVPGHGLLEEWLKSRNIDCYVIPFANGFGKIGAYSKEDINENFVNNYSAALSLKKIAEEKKVELIHSNSSVSNVGAMLAIMLKVPHIWHLREFGEEDFGCEFWDKKLKCELFDYTDAVITISKSVKKYYLEKYGVDSICLYNGLDIKRYISEIDDRFFSTNFLLAGAFVPEKGQMEAVKAVEYLSEIGESVSLKLIGEGDERFIWILKKYIQTKNLEKSIEILPFQKNLTEMRKKCDFVIMASRKEALGRVTLEAMLAGNVVIGADTGGTLELIGENQERGYLYHQGNYVSLAETMKLVLNKGKNFPNDLNILRKWAQKYVVENFDTQFYAKKIIKIYKEVVKKHVEKDTNSINYMNRKLRKQYEKLINQQIVLNEQSILFGEKLLKKILLEWQYIEEKKYAVSDFFIRNRIENVAIYGMAYLGCKLYDELEKHGIKIKYVIDKNPRLLNEVMRVYDPGEYLPEVGCIVVTALKEEELIKTFLRQKCDYEIYGISQILNSIKNELGDKFE